MIIGQPTDIYPINYIDNQTYVFQKQLSVIIQDATNRGYNSGFLMRGLFRSNTTGYTAIYANINLDSNNDIYLYQDENWGSGNNRSGLFPNGGNLNAYGYLCNAQGNIVAIGGTTHTWDSYTYNNKVYRGFGIGNAKALEGDTVFFTTLSYNRLFLNDHNIAPVVHNWRAADSVTGLNGTFYFSKIAANAINNGEAVHGATDAAIERFSEQTEVHNLLKNAPANTLIRPIYAGKSDNLELELIDVSTPIPISIGQLGIYINQGDITFWSDIEINNVVDKIYLSFLIDDENQVAIPSFLYTNVNPISIDYNINSASEEAQTKLYLWLNSHSPDPEINEGEEPGGVDPWTDEPIDGLEAPTIDAIATGFTSLYQVTKGELEDLARFLWSNNFVENMAKFFSDPREIIVGITIMPFAPSVGSPETIIAGGISTGIVGNPVTSQYQVYDFGEVFIQEEKGNFLDWGGYTTITAHLPFVGSHSLDTDDVMGKTLALSYILDFMTGSCVACIKVNGSAHYFFGGAAGIQVPTSSEDFSRLYSSVLAAGASIGGSLATVATGGGAAPAAVGMASSVAANTMNMKANVSYTSGSGSINGMLSSQSAYITIERPNEKLASNQYSYIGQLSLTSGKVKNYDGFTKCYKAHLDGVTATDEEKKEILNYLMNGYRRETGSTLPSVTPVVSGNIVILFLQCTSENDVLGKSWSTTSLKLEGKLVYNQSILTPEFIVEGDATGYNYAYIPLFNRYYYIKDIVVNGKNVETVSFKVDPLQSFKSQIDECDIMVERNRDSVNAKMNDAQYFTLQNTKITTVHFKDPTTRKKIKFDRNNNCYILTIAGTVTQT